MIDLNEYKNKIIAHRGVFDNKTIPENSIKAFKLALNKNLTIELDVHLTKDNKLVVFHDDNLKRMTGVDSIIESFTLKEIKKLKLLDTNETIPTLKEVLNLVDGKVLLDIEIKINKGVKKIVKKLLETLDTYNGKVIIKSFNPLAVKEVKKNTNKYLVGLLVDYYTDNKIFNFLSKTNIIIPFCKPDFLGINKKMLNTKNIKRYLNKLPIMIWTIKKEDEITKINNENFIYICNNLPYNKN